MDDIDRILEIALAHQKAGRLDAAREIYQKILEIDPGHADAHHLLGLASLARGEHDEALELISRAILLRPDRGEYHASIAGAHLALGRPGEAESHGRRARELAPELLEAHYNLGNALFAQGRAGDAAQAFEAALAIDPEHQGAWTNYLFALNFSPGAGRQTIFEANRRWGARLEARIGGQVQSFANRMDPAKRLSLAYYLPELETHVTPRFLAPLLGLHDRDGFAVHCYGYRADGGPAPETLAGAVDQWHEVGGLDAAQLAGRMRADGVDILVHPCSFKTRYRELLAHWAAPLQVVSTNLVSTTGLAEADYLITDPIIDPPGESEQFYTEKLIRLGGFNCYLPPAGDLEVAPAPSLASGRVTFASFNNPAKLSDPALGAWARILGTAPGSRLILKHRAFDDAAARQALAARFKDLGGEADGLEFRGFTSEAEAYLAQYADVDVILDPFPFGGGTTSYEGLWMGVPVLTLAGGSFMGRLGASLMSRVGLADFVATTEADYVARAVGLSGDIPRLGEIRGSLPAAARASIFDAPGHVAEMDGALRQAWAELCAKNPDRAPRP